MGLPFMNHKPLSHHMVMEDNRNEHRFFKTWTTKELERARKLRKEGLSLTTIGHRLGRSRYSIAGAFYRYGIGD